MNIKRKGAILFAGVALSVSSMAYGFPFSTESIQGSFDSTIAVGFGVRLLNQDCSLVGDPTSACGAQANVAQYSNGESGNLNYNKGDAFTTYLKGTHELLLKLPEGWKFMARGSWFHDFKATDTERTQLEPDAKHQLTRDLNILDFWFSRDFALGGQRARVRVGNQVQNWGESVFAAGGINVTNQLDLQKLLIPGTQVKEAVLPAPMFSFATGLGHGVNLDAYYQFYWFRNRVPPVGSYFSTDFDTFDKGRQPLYLNTQNFNFGGVNAASVARSLVASGALPGPARTLGTIHQVQNLIFAGDPSVAGFNTAAFPFVDDLRPKNTGQYGVALHYRPEGKSLDVGFYYIKYHDKNPVLESLANGTERWDFLRGRELYGLSTNFPLGDWAIGWELSYRPRDAITLGGCFNPGGPLDANTNAVVGINCPGWIDRHKYQMHLTEQINIIPANYPTILKVLGGPQTAVFTAEEVWVRYPGVSPSARYFRTINGVPVVQAPDPTYAFFTENSVIGPTGVLTAGTAGNSNSVGYTADFNWTYDGTIIPGWQVTPGNTFSQSVHGTTPNEQLQFAEGAKADTVYLIFTQNPTKGGRSWIAGLNYVRFFGGDPIRQPLKDRDFIGGYVSYNF